MSAITRTFRRDANRVPIWTLGIIDQKDIAFDGGAGSGATGTTTLFTVTGDVAVNVFGLCTTDLAGASATVEIGTASSTASLASQQTATNVDNHEVWHDSVLAIGGAVSEAFHVVDEDIILTVATQDVTGGAMSFYCTWTPLSDDANLVVA